MVSVLWPLNGFDWKVFPLDAVLCAVLVAGSRLALRLRPQLGTGAHARARAAACCWSAPAGRAEAWPASCARTPTCASSASSTTTRRCGGVACTASSCSAPSTRSSPRSRPPQPDEVLITIPNAAAERLEPITQACAAARSRLPARPPAHRDRRPGARRGRRSSERAPRRGLPAGPGATFSCPLLAAYFAFSAFYVWQAWRRETPSIFTDELELTQISRAIAHTGHPARREVPYHFTSLYPYFTAPAWWLHATQEAFDTIKYLGVLAMTAAIFPAYGIARIVLSPRWAVAAAVGAIAAPALSYSPILVEEPLAYLASTIALWLIVRARPAPGAWLGRLGARRLPRRRRRCGRSSWRSSRRSSCRC